MTYNEAVGCLNSFTKAGKPIQDLSRFKNLMAVLGNVQDKLKHIHIAGTNGKGSICEYIALALEYCGCKTGKFTSPYINKVEERIQINGEPISESDFAFYIEKVKKAAEKTECSDYSQFEILNAAAFLYFYDNQCDYVVLETGIGGSLDCSNIVDPVLSVITTVDLDHCKILGDTVEEIAAHKAGIIKPNRPAVISPFQFEPVLEVMKKRAAETKSRLIIPKETELELVNTDLNGTDFSYQGKPFHTKMCGRHQMINAAAAVEALRELKIGEGAIEKALRNAAVPARAEMLNGFLVDGAHNVSGARALAKLIKTVNGKKVLITGMLKSKDYKGALSELLPLFDQIIAVDFFSGEAVKAEEIIELAESLNRKGEIAKSAEDAIHKAGNHAAELRVICGSLYLCGAMRKALLKGNSQK